jgi:transposase
MNIPVRIGMDTSKSVFQLHGVDESEVVVVRRQFRRAEMIRYFERLPRFSSPSSPAAARIIGRACCSRSATRSS